MSDLIVPGSVRQVRATLDGKMIWVYGEPKIGKTTFASGLGNCWFIATEKGQDFVSVREPTQIDNWAQFRKLVEALYREKPRTFGDGQPIQWLVIDVVDKLHRYCSDHCCKELGIEDPSELAMGKGWARVRNEFHKVMNALRTLPYGLVCISHEGRKEQTVRNVKSFRMQPNIGAAGYDWLLGASDLIVRFFARDVPELGANNKPNGRFINERVMQLHPNAAVVAGGRMSQYLPPTLPLSAKALLDTLSKADASASATADGTAAPHVEERADDSSSATPE